MATDDDFRAAVAAAKQCIWTMLWDVAPSRRERVAEAAVRAAAPFLNGSERARVAASDSDGIAVTRTSEVNGVPDRTGEATARARGRTVRE